MNGKIFDGKMARWAGRNMYPHGLNEFIVLVLMLVLVLELVLVLTLLIICVMYDWWLC